MKEFEQDILKMLQHVAKKEPFSCEFFDAVASLNQQEDPHAELKSQYERDVETCKTIDDLNAFDLWQMRNKTGNQSWGYIPGNIDWTADEYRRHPHADLMIEYHRSDKQKKNRLQSRDNENEEWGNPYELSWNCCWQYRFKPETITINCKAMRSLSAIIRCTNGKEFYK